MSVGAQGTAPARLVAVRRGRARTVAVALLGAIASLLVVSVITFLATNATGTDPAKAALGRLSTPEQVEYFREQQGLNEPAVARYFTWLGNTLRGDWGISFSSQRPVTDLVLPRAARSVLLAAIALAVALPVAFMLAAAGSRRPGGRVDNILSVSTLLVIGLPEFVIGLALLYLLAVWLDLLPPDSTSVAFGGDGVALGYVLPALTLAVVLIPYIARMLRSSVRDVYVTPYVQSALLRGVGDTRLYVRHVLRNALGPAINVIALSLGEVLVGDVIIENVFGFPGLGQLTVQAISTGDIAVVQSCVLLAAGGFVLLNLAADAAVVLINPRLRRHQA